MAAAASAAAGDESLPPLLLHLDVNKTVIFSDSAQSSTIEDGVRESVAELFWGKAWVEEDELLWEWTKDEPSCFPPDDTDLLTYSVYCKRKISDRKGRKQAVRDLRLVKDPETRMAMEKIAQAALTSMQLPSETRDSADAVHVGLTGSSLVMFPALFHMVAKLQRSGRTFAILFRTFGEDHEIVMKEWNSFCEMRHPVFSSLLRDIGPLDGSVAGLPDRRHRGTHTLYRDEVGPMLALDICTSGPEGSKWDSWAKQKPKPDKDTRGGRAFIAEVSTSVIDGYPSIRQWMLDLCRAQSTAIIKDDWAWWHYHGETAVAGKLMLLEESILQIFFDDNVEHDDARVVDCRASDGSAVPWKESLNKLMTKVNPVEAVLDEAYFLKQLCRCTGDEGFMEASAGAGAAEVAPPSGLSDEASTDAESGGGIKRHLMTRLTGEARPVGIGQCLDTRAAARYHTC